jgi:hypothetical protein
MSCSSNGINRKFITQKNRTGGITNQRDSTAKKHPMETSRIPRYIGFRVFGKVRIKPVGSDPIPVELALLEI